MAQSRQYEKPTQEPPVSAGIGAGDDARPVQQPADALTATAAQVAPDMPLQEGAAAGVTAWVTSKTINALFSINQNRNSWLGVANVGWKKLSNNSDSAVVALTMLGAHAKDKQSSVNYREEADGMIHEMYVW